MSHNYHKIISPELFRSVVVGGVVFRRIRVLLSTRRAFVPAW